MISRWPCRSGVLLVDDTVYVTAGMWPSHGIYIYALDARTGKEIWRNDTGGNVHAMVGKVSFADEDLKQNIVAFVDHIRRMKPATARGQYMKRVCISGSMTPSVTIQVSAAGTVE